MFKWILVTAFLHVLAWLWQAILNLLLMTTWKIIFLIKLLHTILNTENLLNFQQNMKVVCHKSTLCIKTIFRSWMEKQIKVCKNLLWYPIIWQNHHGYCIKFLWHPVNNWRHHGTAYWLLRYKWNRNTLFWNKNHF